MASLVIYISSYPARPRRITVNYYYVSLFKASSVLVKDKLTILTKTGFSILDDFQNQVLRIEFQELGFKNQTLFKGTGREISKQVKTSQRENNSVE